MKRISRTTTYRDLIIEFTIDIYPPDPDAGYNFPIADNLEIKAFDGVDWEKIVDCLTDNTINNIVLRCHEDTIEEAMRQRIK